MTDYQPVCGHGVPTDSWCDECKNGRKMAGVDERLPRPISFGPATIHEDPEADGSMDDLFVRGGIESFHMERMDDAVWWAALYLADGSRITLHLWREGKRIAARWEPEP